ncbi:hypothetical protein K9M79_05940 [Candidatus Woesearchaeota archaeon]|nr:hypothetical protein [Candidatus Woesearchaeota archaeon]
METNNPDSIDYTIGALLLEKSKDNQVTRILDKVAAYYISGYDRHSVGVVMGYDDALRSIYDFPTYPNANVITAPVPLSDVSRDLVSRVRTQEGISIFDKSGYVTKNGVKLPEADCDFLINHYNVDNLARVCEIIGVQNEVGSKTLALLDLSIKHPELTIARLDGYNYLLKQGKRYELNGSDNKNCRSP